MNRNILFSLSTVLITITLLFSQNDNTDQSPFMATEQGKQMNPSSMWDLEFSFNVTAATGAPGNAGAEFDGTYFYTTRWAANLIHKFDMSGNLLEEFSIPGVTGLRDLAFDGTYMYGGAASTIIYQMDFNAKTLIGTISSPVAVRFIAYDEGNDAFWCGNWSDDPTLVSRNGAMLASFSTGFTGQYGAAYDNVDPGGPYLWIFNQGPGAGTPQIISQWAISSGTATGVTHDVMSDVGLGNTAGLAGGLFTTIDLVPGQLFLGGLLQGTPDMFFVYELWDCGIAPPSNPYPLNQAMNVPVNLNHLSWVNSPGAQSTELYFGIHPDSLVLVQSGSLDTLWNITQGYLPLEYLTTYFWKIRNLGTACGTTYEEWSFTTEEEIPVEFASFTAEVIGGKILLNWGTATETNNKGFEVQRSEVSGQISETGGQRSDWKKIGFIEGNGTTTLPHYYCFEDKNIVPGSYIYRLKQIDFNGEFNYSMEIKAAITAPVKFSLEQNYPNPFNPTTVIEYSIPEDGYLTLRIYNVLGQEVAVIVDGFKKAGSYKTAFDASGLFSGVYYYRIESTAGAIVRKMVVMK